MYYLAFPLDGWNCKSVVCLAFLVEFVQTIIATRDAFRQLASGWGNLIELDKTGLYWLSIIVLTLCSELLCQLFYAWRIFVLCRSWYVPGFILLVGVQILLCLSQR